MAAPTRKHADPLLRRVSQLQAQLGGIAGPLSAAVQSFNGRMGVVRLAVSDLTALGVAFVASTVASFQGRTGAVTLTKADVTGTGLAAADVSAVGTAQVGAASGVAGLDASSRLMIPAGTSAPSTGTGAIGVGTLIGWVPVDIGGVISKIPIFQ